LSNYLSKTYIAQPPISYVDLGVVEKTLNTLEGKYNANNAAIQQALLTYNTKLKGLRDSDNEYIAGRLKEVTSVIDNYSQKNGNLAYSYNKDSILSAVTSLMDDPIVQDAVASTANKAAYDTQYQQILKKDPKLANSANYEYGQFAGGYQDYMQGKSKKLGAMQYTPYTDLTEENLKKLKTIKEIKGKRFVEYPDPTNPGQIITKEIDGLEDWEINKYLGSTMTSQELGQMRINSWAKFGGNNIEANRSSIVSQYDDYKNQKNTYYTNQKELNDAIANNSSMPDDKRAEATRRSKELTESINDLKAMDASVLDTTTVASTLERASYLNGISQLAGAEWSSGTKKDEVYFENQKLDLDKQKFELEKQKLDLEQFKALKEAGVDAQGNPITTGVVSQTPMASELAETIQAEGTGQGTLKADHDRAYRGVISEAEKFLQTGSEEDVNTLKAELNLRGVEIVNGQYKFKDEKKKLTNSLANTVYESFNATKNTTPEMYKDNEIKRQKAQELLTVKRDAYSKVFNQAPEDYIDRLKREIRTANIDGQSDIFEDSAKEDLNKARMAESFVNRNGGWGNLKTSMQKNPEKLAEFAEVLNTLTTRFQKTPTISMNWVDLKENAKGEIEKTIQNKTKSGAMMSAYNQFNIVDDKVKENVLKNVVNDEIIGGEGMAFDPKQNVTIRKSGGDIYLAQRQIAGTGKGAHPVDLTYKVNAASSLYSDLSKYVDLGVTSSQNYIQADKDVKIPPMKVSMPSYATSKTGQQTMAYRVEASIPLSAKKAFGIVNGQPGRLATKELASEEITARLLSFGIPKEKADIYKQKVLSNLNAYQIKTLVKPNPAANFRNEFAIEVLDNTGKRITDGFLGTDKLGYDMKYSMEMFPQVYVLNQLLYSASVNRNNIDEEINKL
jgi:hypothetical protein